MSATATQGSRFGTPEQLEVLTAIEPYIAAQMGEHLARRKLWFPNDLMPADAHLGEDDEDRLRALRSRAKGLNDGIRVTLALNLLTEEGLPHFHRLIASHMGNQSVWQAWNNVWTAEEDRHGCAIRDYVRDARLFDMGALEQMQYLYISAGFDPEWHQDPYRLMAYTSLQEKATQISHANTGRQAGHVEPTLQRVLAHIAGDEGRHYQFYRATFAEVLRTDPNVALSSLLRVTLGFAMPGHNIAGFAEMSEVVRRIEIFGPDDFETIVTELLEYWKIASMTGLNAAGARAQEKLMEVPARLTKIAQYQKAKAQPRSFAFDFIYNREVVFK